MSSEDEVQDILQIQLQTTFFESPLTTRGIASDDQHFPEFSTPLHTSGSDNRGKQHDLSIPSFNENSFPSLTDADISGEIRDSVSPDRKQVKELSCLSPDHLRFKRTDLIPELKALLVLMARLQKEQRDLEEKKVKLEEDNTTVKKSFLTTDLKSRIDICKGLLGTWSEIGFSKGKEMRSIQEALDQFDL